MKNNIAQIIFAAFIIRLILLTINNYWFTLPQGGADALRFDRNAYYWSLGNLPPLSDVLTNGARLHVWLGSLLYSFFGRVPFLWGFIMVLLGTGTIYNIHKAVYLITSNYKLSNRSAWIAAIFPNFAVLSALILREAPIFYFVSLALVFLIKYIKFHSLFDLLKFFVFGVIGSIFHSAVFSLFIGFVFYNVVLNKKSTLALKLFVVVLCTVTLYFVNSTGVGLSKFGGSFEGAIETLGEEQGVMEHAGSNYPSWLLLKGQISDVLLLPVRFIAFFLAPFIPFLVKSGSHLIGVVDGILYFFILRNIYLSRKILIKNEMSKAILVVAISVGFAFSFGASNFGTNIRHRAKALPILLMLPLLAANERIITTRNTKYK